MKLLALDTSTDRLCVALCLDGLVLGHEEAGGPQASQRLLPAAQALLARPGLKWTDLDGLAYGEGPGAFTGLRGTCAAVQGLALGLGLGAVGVPSLLIVADDARQQALNRGLLTPAQACTVAVAVDARMGQVYEQGVRWDGRRWLSLTDPQVRSPEEVALAWASHGAMSTPQAEPWVLAGSGLSLLTGESWLRMRARALLEAPQALDRSAALGRCAQTAWDQGPPLDAAQVMPRYVRDRVALTTAERLAGGAGSITTAMPAPGCSV